VKQCLVSIGFFAWMHVLSREVLDDLHFARAAIVERLDLHEDGGEAGESRCTEAPPSDNQLEVFVQWPHDDRRQESMRSNAPTSSSRSLKRWREFGVDSRMRSRGG
jgi:hypothetical protein